MQEFKCFGLDRHNALPSSSETSMIPIATRKQSPTAIIWKVAALISLSWNLPNDELALKNELSRLESSWSSLDGWLNFWTLVVVIGVAVELIVIIVEYRREKHEFNRGIIRPPDKPSVSLLIRALIGAGLVAIGVAGEFSVHVKAGRVETDVRNIAGRLVGIANAKAGEANERAAKLEKEAAEIEESVAPRRLTAKQRKLLASHLRKFAGRTLTVFTDPSDAEAVVFASEIYLALKSAKWNVDSSSSVGRGGGKSMTVAPDLPATGIDVPCGPPKLRDAAGKALVRELSKMGFDSQCSKATGLWPLEVLSRPEGPRGDAKLRAEAKKRQQASAQIPNR